MIDWAIDSVLFPMVFKLSWIHGVICLTTSSFDFYIFVHIPNVMVMGSLQQNIKSLLNFVDVGKEAVLIVLCLIYFSTHLHFTSAP
jgi:hypothetical protein